jgi:hypothetical protein
MSDERSGALEALSKRPKRHGAILGVTGHVKAAPAMHLRSLVRFDFDSVLLPGLALSNDPAYAAAVRTSPL